MSIKVILRRMLFLFVVIWAASTIVFFIPRLSTQESNPRTIYRAGARTAAFRPPTLEIIIQAYNKKFGLDKPLWQQYSLHGQHAARRPGRVAVTGIRRRSSELIMDALPWTTGLLLVTTILSFIIGNLLGAVAAWPRSPGWLRTSPPRLSCCKGCRRC